MTSLALDLSDLRRLTEDPYRAFRDSCAEATAHLRHAREAVEGHWFELPADVQQQVIEFVGAVRQMPKRLGFWQRVRAVLYIGWSFIFVPNRGVSEAVTLTKELLRFVATVENMAKEQERRQRWLYDTAPIGLDACAQGAQDTGRSFSLEELRERVAGQR